MVSVTEYIAAKKKKNPNLRLGSLSEISKAQSRAPISSGNLVLDYVTSIGGIPRGVVTEMRGFNSSGKSTAAAMTAAQHQRRVREGKDQGAILYIDFEYAVDAKYFGELGLDVNDPETFIYYQPDNLEEGFNTFLEMTKEGLLALCVVDSIAGASAEAEYEATIGKLSIGQKAKALNQALRMSVGPMKVNGTGLILINHTQHAIPQNFIERSAAAYAGPKKVSPGGTAMEFYPSLRLEFSPPALNKGEIHDELLNDNVKKVSSTDVTVTAFKNKVGVPYRSGKMRVQFGKGFSQTYAAFHILVDHKIIKKGAAGKYTFPEALLPEADFKVPVGEEKILKAIDSTEEWKKLLVDFAWQLVNRKQVDMESTEVVIMDEEAEDEYDIDPDTGEVLGSNDE